jgi:hypothetical protein
MLLVHDQSFHDSTGIDTFLRQFPGLGQDGTIPKSGSLWHW